MPARTDPLELRSTLNDVAATQGGYFTARQALKAGYSYPAQTYHANRGAWERVDRGIFRLRGWPTPQHPDLIRWTLWSRGEGIVSHQSALALDEIGDFSPAVVHLTLPEPTRRAATGVELHVGRVAAEEIEHHGGFRATKPLRSLLDTASSEPEPDQLATAIAEALDRGLVTTEALRRRIDEFGPAGALALERALRQLERR